MAAFSTYTSLAPPSPHFDRNLSSNTRRTVVPQQQTDQSKLWDVVTWLEATRLQLDRFVPTFLAESAKMPYPDDVLYSDAWLAVRAHVHADEQFLWIAANHLVTALAALPKPLRRATLSPELNAIIEPTRDLFEHWQGARSAFSLDNTKPRREAAAKFTAASRFPSPWSKSYSTETGSLVIAGLSVDTLRQELTDLRNTYVPLLRSVSGVNGPTP